MKKLCAVVALMCLASVVLAAEAPNVVSPKDGDRVGRNVDVIGTTDGMQFVVIVTDVYVKGELNKSVPGHRHWTDEDGNFALRIAAPLVRNAENCDIKYKIRVFTQRPGEEKSPDAVVTCYPN